jgi:thioredoxin-like negative regulator of GroEL
LWKSAIAAGKRVEEADLPFEKHMAHSMMPKLAGLYKRQGRYDEAEPLLKAALDYEERKSKTKSPIYDQIAASLAEVYRAQNRNAEADATLKSIPEDRRKFYCSTGTAC